MSGQTLYRFFDAGGSLLYVGMTADVGVRLERHEIEKRWWADATSVTLEHYDTRDEVASAELAAIRTEHPKYNIANHPRHDRRVARVSALIQHYAEAFGFLPKGQELDVWIEAMVVGRLVSDAGSISAAADQLGCSRGWVDQRLDLFELPDQMQARVFSGELPVWRARQEYQLSRSGQTRRG